MKRDKFTVQQVADAIRKNRGSVMAAATSLGCAWSSVYRYCERYPELAELVVKERETMLNTAELMLYEAIDKKKPWAICFFLKCQGKGRGWIERTEFTGKDGAPLLDAGLIQALVNIFQEVNVIQDPQERKVLFARKADNLLEAGAKPPQKPGGEG